jgi:uncharacterized membrane protein
MVTHVLAKKIGRAIFGSPDYDRLAGAIEVAKIDFYKTNEDWANPAKQYLKIAEGYLQEWNIQQGWAAFKAAQRAILMNPNDPDAVRRAAIVLRREAKKLDDWRAEAIKDLICNSEGKLREDLGNLDDKSLADNLRARVLDAIALRDDGANTTYHKISLRRRSLFQLFLVLSIGIAICLALSYFKKIPAPFNETQRIAAVILFGVLGATISVAQGLLAADVKAKIPAQQIGAFIVWMRPGIGAAAALIAYALVFANKQLSIITPLISDDFPIIAVIAFAAGFSERFIVGAIGKISELATKS